MKKILHFITGLEKGGGAENMLLKTLPYLKKIENRVCVVKGVGDIGKKIEEKGIKVHYLKMKNWFDLGVIYRYKKVINEFKPDIQVNYLIHSDIFGRLFAKRFGVKKVISYIRSRYSIDFFYYYMDKFTLRFTDYVLTNSKTGYNDYKNKHKYPIKKLKCIFNGIDISNQKELVGIKKKRNELGVVDDGDLIISCVARLHKNKDHSTILKAIKIIKDKGIINIRVLFCGDGPEINKLKKDSKDLGVNNEIIFLGNRDDIMEILSISDIFILASFHEGMSNALLEAMNSGVVCVVSDILENKELINNESDGLVFKVGEEESLAEKLDYLINNKEQRIKFSQKAFEKIKKKYDIKIIREKLDDFLFDF